MAQFNARNPVPDARLLAARIAEEGMVIEYAKGRVIFSQGEQANSIFAIRKGWIKLTANGGTQHPKQAVIAILKPGDLLGESSLRNFAETAGATTLSRCEATATAITDCSVARLARRTMRRLLLLEPVLAELVLDYMLRRNLRLQADLVDLVCNSSEKRLARLLLVLANYYGDGLPEPVIPRINHATLAEMVGTTRSRVSFFMNRFRRLGYVKYDEDLGVHSSLFNALGRGANALSNFEQARPAKIG